jgi:hypothetical protein
MRRPKQEARPDADFLALARKRFQRCVEAEDECRRLEIEDRRFHAADSDNGWQWDQSLRNARQNDPNGARPCLTINKLPQHIGQVTNDQRMNRPSLKAIPVDDKADPETAEILTGVFRHIQVNSDAETAYDTACEQQVISGVGYWRVLTAYVDDDAGVQDILIRRVKNRFSIYLDPDCQDATGADARFAFVTEELDEDEFKEQFPDAEPVDWKFDEREFPGWYVESTRKVRIAEYFYVERPKRGRPKVHWCKLSGKEKLETNDWAGKYIPIVRVVGSELEIEGSETIVKGMVRNAKDAQRMYNYNASMEVEQNALAPKAPFIGYAGQFEGFEDRWAAANRVNYPYLEVNPVVDEVTRQVLPLPQRQPPAFTAQAFIQAKLGAADDIKATMGQYDASLGSRSNEQSGRAIIARQREGDTATYHYIDNLSKAIKQTGRIILDLIPYIYDTRRVARIIGEDGTTGMAIVDPSLPTAYQESDDRKIRALFNPSIGRYDVVVSVGPNYSTKRQEAADAMTQTASAWPKLMDIAGDVVVKSQDWPGAEDIAKRIKATIPQEIRGADDGEEEPMPPAALQFMQQAKAAIGELQGRLQAAEEVIQKQDQELQQTKSKGYTDSVDASVESARLEVQLLEEKKKRIALEIQVAEGEALVNQAREVVALGHPEAPESPQASTDISMLIQALAAIAAKPPEPPPVVNVVVEKGGAVRKEISIQAPSGAVYHGVAQDTTPQ